MRLPRLIFAFLLAAAVTAAYSQSTATTNAGNKAQKLPVTTSSAAAARYFETGMVHYENHRWNFALRDWREAVALDPKFALAHTWICFTTTDPAEESQDRAKAKALLNHITRQSSRWSAGWPAFMRTITWQESRP
jgi:hypothetical protein